MNKTITLLLLITLILSCNKKVDNKLNKLLPSGSTILIDTIYNYQKLNQNELLNLVRKLLDNNANPNLHNEHNQNPLGAAILTGNIDIVKLLLSKGADPNIPTGYGESILAYAMRYRSMEITKLLIDKGVDVNYINTFMDDSDSILIKAVKQNNEELVSYLIKYKANKNYLNSEGKKAVDYAHKNKIIEKLLE